MANKNVTITEPTAAHVKSVTVSFSGGVAQIVEGLATIQTTDDHTSHGGHNSNPAADYTAAERTAMDNLAAAFAAKLVAAKGF